MSSPKFIVNNNDNKELCKEFARIDAKEEKIGFNIFQMISNTYYRENFHSYIIYNLLSQKYHPDGNNFLFELIKCINRFPGFAIELHNFENSIVEREGDNIDIRIRDSHSKQSIIIENKINNAIDQPRQIPRYYDAEVKAGYKVEAIIYLTLSKGKRPDKSDWTEQDHKSINDNLFVYLSASDDEMHNSIICWIDNCIALSNNIDVISTLRQYKALIKHLNSSEMYQEPLEKFYSEVLTGENYAIANSIKNMLDKLYEYRSIKIYNEFSSKGFLFFNKVSYFKYGGMFRTKFESSKLESTPKSQNREKNINFIKNLIL